MRKFVGIRRGLSLTIGGYNDRNDGFLRTYFSRSKNRHSRNTKHGKTIRIKPPWKA